ncbi:MAG TPA: CHAT domain-containing protein [Solirubrobacteraceae bacterium]|nr:CHAT domain-containing protein [Solirubrobacteraceae bacterium]
MRDIEYTNFDVFVHTQEEGGYVATVALDGSEFSTTFEAPATLEEFTALRTEMRAARGVRLSPGDGAVAARPALDKRMRALGGQLFDAMFSGQVRDGFSALRRAGAPGGNTGVRIRLNLRQAPKLLVLPWEFLHCDGQFLALSEKTPIVRYLPTPNPLGAVDVTAPIRVLALAPKPAGTEKLAVEEEWRNLETALEPLSADGMVVLELVQPPTIRALRERLQSDTEYHVLHFLGHGSFDTGAQEGSLWLEGDSGGKTELTGAVLADLLTDHDTLRLVLLNSCQGGETSAADPFAGLAQWLVRRSIPAVIAMQSAISDRAAVEFSLSFYRQLGLGRPLEAAVAAGRIAVRTTPDCTATEWATPVFYSRLPDGRLFEVSEFSPENRQLLRDKESLAKLWTAGDQESIALVFGMWKSALSELGEREPAVALPYALMIGELRQFLQMHYDEVLLCSRKPPADHTGPIVYLGGPVTVPAVGKVIERAAPPHWFRGLPYKGNARRRIGKQGMEFAPEFDAKKKLTFDVGVAIRVVDDGRLTFVIAGCYGSGTLGAARLLTDAGAVRELGDVESVERLELVVGVKTDGWQVTGAEALHVEKGW